MGLVLAGVREKIRLLTPEYIGRWSDAFIDDLTVLADNAIREEAETVWKSHTINLNAYALWYSLPHDVVSVGSVQYSRDGVTYDVELQPKSMDELDRISVSWYDDYGVEPNVYSLWCAPGTSNWSRILLWRPLSAVDTDIVRVNYIGCYPDDTDLSAVEVPDWVQDQVYVPFVMSILMRTEDPRASAEYLAEYYRRLPEVYAAFRSKRLERVTALGY